MSKKKKVFSLILFSVLAGGTAAHAQAALEIVHNDASKPNSVFSLDDIRRIDFSDTGFTVNEISGTTLAAAFTDVRKIVFTGLSTGLGDAAVVNKVSKLTLYCRGGKLTAEGLANGERAFAAVYDVGGRAVMSLKNWSGEPIDISGLSRGMYIFKVNNNSIKFTR